MIFCATVFIIVGLSIFLGSHWLVYFSLTRFFSISSSSQKMAIFGALTFLAASFFIASAVSHWIDNVWTRNFYFLAGFWWGLLTNLVLASLGLWIVWGIVKNSGVSLDFGILAAFVFIAAFAFSIYGSWNAFNPRIKNIEVTIRNLPASWQGKKIVQLSDVHLGHIYRDDFLRKIVSMVNSQNPDIVVITGDLFDGMDGDLVPLVRPLDDIRAKGTYFVTGNHETYLGVGKALSVLKNTPVRVLQNEIIDLDGLKLIGISYPESYPERGQSASEVDILQSLKGKFFGQPNILLFHSPVNIKQAKESGVDFQLSGHTHKGQFFPFNLVTSIVYRGYDYGLREENNFSIYTTNGVGTWGPAMRLGNIPEVVVIHLK